MILTSNPMSKRSRRLALAGILILAALVRVTGLGWGLRHPPLRDEQEFVESVGEMIVHHDWNHRFYEYPGLVFDILRPILTLTPPSKPYFSPWPKLPPITHFGWTGYLAARGLIAFAGVLNVLLVNVLGTALIGAEGGLAAALLLAVSPVEAFVGHEFRPDVILETFVLLALLSFRRLGERLTSDAAAGLTVGAAAAVKFTGILVLPPYLLARYWAPGRRTLGMVVGILSATLVWFLATPYAVLEPRAFAGGVTHQLGWHYRAQTTSSAVGNALPFYLMTFVRSLGPLGAGLAVFGLVAMNGRRRDWAPMLLYLITLVASLSTASVHWQRLVLSSLGIATLVAAEGMEALRRRFRIPAWVLPVLAASMPLYWSSAYIRVLLAPDPRDLVASFVAGHLGPGTRVLNGIDGLGLDRTRIEVLRRTGAPSLDRLLARHADAVVWRSSEGDVVDGFTVLFRAEPPRLEPLLATLPELRLGSGHWAWASPAIVLEAPGTLRPALKDVESHATARASSNDVDAPLALDGDLKTAWSTAKSQRSGDFFQVVLERQYLLGRVELLLGARPRRYGRAISVWITSDGVTWRRIPSIAARPPVGEQLDLGEDGARQELLFEPLPARGIRLRLTKNDDHPWSIAELRLQAEGQ